MTKKDLVCKYLSRSTYFSNQFKIEKIYFKYLYNVMTAPISKKLKYRLMIAMSKNNEFVVNRYKTRNRAGHTNYLKELELLTRYDNIISYGKFI